MDPVLARIDAWQQAGLIDPSTADRLRAAETATAPPQSPHVTPATGHRGPSAGDVLGPAPTVVEMLSYLGGGFLIAAWTAFVGRLSGDEGNLSLVGGGLLIAAVVLGGIGLVLRSGDARRRRGAGIAFLGATLYSAAAASGFLSSLHVSGAAQFLVIAAIATAVAAVVRVLHAGLLTQLGLLIAITTLAGGFLTWLRAMVEPSQFSDKGDPIGAVPDPILMIGAGAVVWLAVALGLGLLGLREAGGRRDSADAPGAPARRATMTRVWAGVVAMGGLASSLSTSGRSRTRTTGGS